MGAIRHWQNIETLGSRDYQCGFCGNKLASEKGWIGVDGSNHSVAWIFVCHKCKRPTFFDTEKKQFPGVAFGNPVSGIPESQKDINTLYEEVRKATSANAYTAAVLSCRKLLMHIAVSKGADKDKGFTYYAKYLADKHYVPPDATGWVDHIKDKGNEANHEIVIMGEEDAKDLLAFSEMLLKVIYEYPATVRKKDPQPETDQIDGPQPGES